jgi:putative Mg2+ transporter-C (MgtC) family protein
MISYQVILLRLAIALLLGAAIGFERELKEHSAGMRTLALVSLGSALFTIVSAYGFLALLSIPRLTLDPTRIASYIVAGIGFLGAGTIFLSGQGEKVKGLTTAATIWVVAAIGLACGAGLLLEAGTTTVMVLFVLVLLAFVEKAIVPRISPGTHHIHIKVSSVSGQFIATVYEICARNKVTIEKLHLHTLNERQAFELICRVPSDGTLTKVLSELHALPEVLSIHVDFPGTNRESSTSTGSTD